jgi:site-specific DNA-methyltransferase (adenine-specific)
MINLHHASCIDWLSSYDGPLFDACVTDPPYHLTSIVKRFGGKNPAEAKVGATGAYARASKGFMGKEWDGGDIAFRPETWRAVYDALKPGAHLVAFSGTRTYHRMACAIEDALTFQEHNHAKSLRTKETPLGGLFGEAA